MPVSLVKPNHAPYVGVIRYGWSNTTTHKLVEGWRYDKPIRTKCGREAKSVQSSSSGKQYRITCKSCLKGV
jgi:hypothetical protein